MKQRPSRLCFLLVVLLMPGSGPAFSQSRLVDPQTARQCGCTLRKWPLLSEFLARVAPAAQWLQPETVLPHYVDAGCAKGPGLPAEGVYGDVRFSNLASLDLFIDHDWHDFNFFVKLDGAAYFLNSAANQKNDNNFLCYNHQNKTCPSIRGETLMEVEWDTTHYPREFWASAGDRVWMTGRYIWDCGHPEGYHTEIHPPHALALTRSEPYVFAGDESPSLTNKTYVFVHGKSGMKDYNFRTVEGVESVVFNGYRDAAVANRDYEFDIPLPARPPGHPGQPFAEVVSLPFGGPSPELKVLPSQRAVHVKYPLKLGDPSPERKFGAVIVAGWRAPLTGIKFRKLTVHVEQLEILKSHNPVGRANWILWLNINGQWTEIEQSPETESRLPLNLDRLLNVEGLLGRASSPLKIDKVFRVILPDTDDARLTVQVSGWVDFYDALFGLREDALNSLLLAPGSVTQVFSRVSTREGRIGIFFKQFSKAEGFGVGSHNQAGINYSGELSRGFEHLEGVPRGGFPDGLAETQGDFALAYTVRESP